MSATAFEMMKRFLWERCANVLRDDHAYLLSARLHPIMERFRCSSMERMIADAYEGKNPALAQAILDAMTTHETQFFRDTRFWTELSTVILPPMVRRLSGRRGLRVWSAGCSTGQEAYSLAMLLEERFPSVAARAEIHATDVSPVTVEAARSGIFSAAEVARGLDASRLARHFERRPPSFVVKPFLRDRVRFAVQNLKEAAPVSELDLLLCRNVLIYFSAEDRTAIVKRMTAALANDGILVIGGTESLPGAAKSSASGCYSKQELVPLQGAARPARTVEEPRPRPGEVKRA